MKISIAIETLVLLRDTFIPRLSHAKKHQQEINEAINLGISALQIIQDGDYKL